ncbi:heterokaryon incompatibility protein-domain-containing protein [Rhexocercosporidium sp. MPI-PUGE-AT-0058]|nr:heterokaryon incompatibility protein-domain-containing protein [Rhexocercosporidium sp. MPI-PUGE-AT-0058]
MSLCVLAAQGQPLPPGLEPIPNIDIGSDASLDRARDWLNACVKHPECCKQQLAFSIRPARLLYVNFQQGHWNIRLGGKQKVQTTKENIDAYSASVDFQALPLTIRDAIIVTNRIGLQHLWVDALCIIQDDDSDRDRQIEVMADIFQGAEVTIMASRAKTVHSGFLGRLSRYGLKNPDKVFKVMYNNNKGNKTQIVLAPTNTDERVDHLSKRGWTYQERLRSRRILDFGSTCLSWKLLSVQSKIHIDGIELRLVSCYRLPAIAGVATRHLNRSDTYLAGIWRSDLPQGLLWRTAALEQRPLTYTAPSWSWASNLQRVAYMYTTCDVSQVEIIEVEVNHSSKNRIFGCVTDGYIKLRGYLIEAQWTTNGEDYFLKDGIRLATDKDCGVVFTSYSCQDVIDMTLSGGDTGSIQVHLLVLLSNTEETEAIGLVLRKHSPCQYSRLGLFGSPHYGQHHTVEYLLKGSQQEITII